MHRIARLDDPQEGCREHGACGVSLSLKLEGAPDTSQTHTTRRSQLLHIFIAALQILSRNPCSTFSLVIRLPCCPHHDVRAAS
jgi:hypothetical protein